MKQDSYLFLHTSHSAETAVKVVNHLLPLFKSIDSLLDLGCGIGSWSKAFYEVDIKNIEMVDHPLLSEDKLSIAGQTKFFPIDLDENLPMEKRFDLSLCIEVLEHFSEQRALELHSFLCNSSDLILFSAAIPGQNGDGHLNCQRHSYWHQRFASKGFSYYDGFKPEIMNDDNINYWIRQNLFIYYKPSQAYRFDSLSNITTPAFELVHHSILTRKMGIKEYLKMMPKVFMKKQSWG